MSLKHTLNQIIKERKEITYDELVVLAKQLGCKLETATRKLRPSDSPDIERVWRNGAIIGYKYAPTSPNLPVTAPQTPEPTQSTCCASSTFYKDKNGVPIHSRECIYTQVSQTIDDMGNSVKGLF